MNSGTDAQGTRILLSVEGLRTYFQTPRGVARAVDGVSFILETGKTLGIVGESGCGKSVLAKSIMRLVPEPPGILAGGGVRLAGRDLLKLSEKEMQEVRGREVGMVFQDPMTSLNPVMRIGAQVGEGLLRHFSVSATELRERTIELLKAVGMPAPEQKLDVYPHQLSGGMRQRVVIAVALACRPQLLIADEPTTALDVTIQMQILRLLKRLQTDNGMGMLFISHDLGAVASVADDVAVMYAGRIVERAPTQELFRHMRMPYTEALMQAIPNPDALPHSRLEALNGRPPDLVNPGTGCAFAPRCKYADVKCRTNAPPLEGAGQHQWACWHPLGHAVGKQLAVNAGEQFMAR
ncbi:ABC transporter ATP-binding protein [Noviherbaspirillum sp. DKR-6]|uniref:ABC transporter ATP-binding protein n=2 Tax=Noviherbaspirillum pedocola TaxID=2801341 RepID=A0A934T3U6_9BURK|nr:ABC transporter ATP-binding protein [Noviherbaspirillum pedocola]